MKRKKREPLPGSAQWVDDYAKQVNKALRPITHPNSHLSKE